MTQRQMLQESRSALKSLLRFCLTLSDDELRVGQMVHGRREEKKATASGEYEDAGVQRAVGPGVRRKLLAAARAGHRARWLVRDRDGQPSRRSRPDRRELELVDQPQASGWGRVVCCAAAGQQHVRARAAASAALRLGDGWPAAAVRRVYKKCFGDLFLHSRAPSREKPHQHRHAPRRCHNRSHWHPPFQHERYSDLREHQETPPSVNNIAG